MHKGASNAKVERVEMKRKGVNGLEAMEGGRKMVENRYLISLP